LHEALRFQVGSELSAAQRGSKLASPKKELKSMSKLMPCASARAKIHPPAGSL
jgi:hypothetical protein